MNNLALTKTSLDRLYSNYGPAFLQTDPLRFPHRYKDPLDQEAAGFLSAVFAYGQVSQIFRTLERIFALFPKGVVKPLLEQTMSYWRKRCRGFSYRFQQSEDLACLLWLLRDLFQRHGSIEKSFLPFYNQAKAEAYPIKTALSGWVQSLRGLIDRYPYHKKFDSLRGILHLLPTPETGSPCKRWNLFLRWMVRGPDDLDLGIWESIPASRLILPLDTHTARICRYLGMTSRSASSWAMAEEITESLRALDPEDPVRYDFSLARLGILARCSKQKKIKMCSVCELKRICIHGRALRGSRKKAGLTKIHIKGA